MNILMVGVDEKRVGGMWTVAKEYIDNTYFNSRVKLKYIATSTNGSILARFLCMLKGYMKIQIYLIYSKVDIVHIHMAEKGSTFRKGKIAKWSKKRGKKVIIHMHAGPFMDWYDTLSNKKKKKVKQYFCYVDKVLVLGEFWKKKLVRIIPKEKMIVLYNGVSCPLTNRYNTASTDIIYFGVMNRAKGIYDLLEALSRIKNKLPENMNVKLCGNDMEGNIADTVEKYNLNGIVQELGWVNIEQRLQIFENAMIDILPSYYEGLSMAVIEAMSYGIPVITTNISTMPELLSKSDYLFDPGNVDELSSMILELIADKEKRKKISEIEFEDVKNKFSEDAFISNTLKIYEHIMGR